MDWILALIGGAMIGTAVSIMLLLNGRVTGIAGIVNGTLEPKRGDTEWRWAFVVGLFVGGLLLHAVRPTVFEGTLESPLWTVVLAGWLVGFGTILGSGCTSGHGVCGLSRLSPRSVVATLSFMLSGILAVYIFRQLGWLP